MAKDRFRPDEIVQLRIRHGREAFHQLVHLRRPFGADFAADFAFQEAQSVFTSLADKPRHRSRSAFIDRHHGHSSGVHVAARAMGQIDGVNIDGDFHRRAPHKAHKAV